MIHETQSEALAAAYRAGISGRATVERHMELYSERVTLRGAEILEAWTTPGVDVLNTGWEGVQP